MARRALILATMVSPASRSSRTAIAQGDITRATLDNGLRVVIVRDPLAPVVTIEDNYLVGANETARIPWHGPRARAHGVSRVLRRHGRSDRGRLRAARRLRERRHAAEHHAVLHAAPAADLEVALRLDAACMQDIDDSDAEWAQEKGAIEQEVARDLSEPTYKFLTRLNEDSFPGTPYGHDALGTRESFEATTGEMLRRFHRDWYAPNNAILLVVGNVDRQRWPSSGGCTSPLRAGHCRPGLTSCCSRSNRRPSRSTATCRTRSRSSGTGCPGTDSPDFAAARVMADVLASQRGDLYALVRRQSPRHAIRAD